MPEVLLQMDVNSSGGTHGEDERYCLLHEAEAQALSFGMRLDGDGDFLGVCIRGGSSEVDIRVRACYQTGCE